MNWHAISPVNLIWLSAIVLVTCLAAALMALAGLDAVRQWLKRRGSGGDS